MEQLQRIGEDCHRVNNERPCALKRPACKQGYRLAVACLSTGRGFLKIWELPHSHKCEMLVYKCREIVFSTDRKQLALSIIALLFAVSASSSSLRFVLVLLIVLAVICHRPLDS